jgi:hypothetical protein
MAQQAASRRSKRGVSPEQLLEVGAIALLWNQVDGFIDWLLMIALRLDIRISHEVTSRINGSDGKLEILLICANQAKLLNAEARKAMKISLRARRNRVPRSAKQKSVSAKAKEKGGVSWGGAPPFGKLGLSLS